MAYDDDLSSELIEISEKSVGTGFDQPIDRCYISIEFEDFISCYYFLLVVCLLNFSENKQWSGAFNWIWCFCDLLILQL